jgi:NADPH2:quinone reductase
MAKVVLATAFGGPEVLSVVEQPVREPGPGEAVVLVRAAGVNPIELKLYAGTMVSDPSRLPMRLGSEAAGVVTAVGPDAVGPEGPVAVGDEVIAFRVSGAYASEIVVKATSLVAKPRGLAWPSAAGLMLTGATAVHLLTATGVAEGDTVLVHGGSGGVGLMVVQLAVLRGATVVATAGAGNHDLLRGFGATPVTYGEGLADRVREAAPEGVDVALDLIGTDEALDVSLELVSDRDRIATIANFVRGPESGIKVLGGGPGADPGDELRAAARPELARLAGDGSLTVVVAEAFGLEQVADAHRVLAEGHTTGRIVLLP